MRVVRQQREITRAELKDWDLTPDQEDRLDNGGTVAKGGYELRLRRESTREDQMRRAGALKRLDSQN